jgi:hypothetical protein
MGHEDAFPPPRLSARYRFSQGTLQARQRARRAAYGHSPDIVDSGSVRPYPASRGPRISCVSRGLFA